jgi:pimeloyl-ACP methyl ester carboxylesterase/DNA-binding CsgD family transcriptional regulator
VFRPDFDILLTIFQDIRPNLGRIAGSMKRVTQTIRYVRTADNVRLAWAEAGAGPVIVKAANWLTHLEYEWESPVWRHWMQFFSGHFRYIRHDERGCGMTEMNVGDLSLERWVKDLEDVIKAAGVSGPVTLLGISQGGAICAAYAAKHPERVSKLILYGGYARGPLRRGDPKMERFYLALIDIVRFGWYEDNPAFRQVFTSRFIPDGTNEQIGWFNDLCRKTTTPEIAEKLMASRSTIDVTHLLGMVKAPTLVMHCRDDGVVPIEEGHVLAAGIPGAQFIELDSKNHVLLENEPAWKRFCDEVLDFMGLHVSASVESTAFAALSRRERQVLALVAEGFGNAEIGERLCISEKTVRNHVSNVFDKLGVWSRAQAIVFARDRGFGNAEMPEGE